jgi:hypothetical protein
MLNSKAILMQELEFEVTQEVDGGFVAESLGDGLIDVVAR